MRVSLAAMLAAGIAGCQVYLAGGPSGEPARASAGPPERAAVRYPPGAAAPAAPASRGGGAASAPAVSAPASTVRRPTFPGERFLAAGTPRAALLAAEDVLAGEDYRILRSGMLARGAELQAERRARIDTHPPTTSSPAWQATAATIRIAGAGADCCYVTAGFTTSRLNSAGDLLGTTHAEDPENAAVRAWFFDALAARFGGPGPR